MDGRTMDPGDDQGRDRGARRGPDVTGLALAVLLIGAGAVGGLCRRVWTPARGAPGASAPASRVDPVPGAAPSAGEARRPRPRLRASAAAPGAPVAPLVGARPRDAGARPGRPTARGARGAGGAGGRDTR